MRRSIEGVRIAVVTEQLESTTPKRAPRSRRRKLPWGFLLAGVAIAGAVAYLVIANTGTSAEYYMTVAELHHCAPSCDARSVRVAGWVTPNTIQRDAKSQILHFVVSDTQAAGSPSMSVVYGGVVPDIFKPGIQVVVEGHVVNGVFQANNLLAKCPSKFQSATPNASGQ